MLTLLIVFMVLMLSIGV